METNIK